jgi:hypothetical protein
MMKRAALAVIVMFSLVPFAFPAKRIIGGPVMYGGHEYYLVESGAGTWQHVEDYAVELGGHLASINDAEEETFIRAFVLANHHGGGYWIGLHRQSISDPWEWVNGDLVEYTNWAGGPGGDCVNFITTGPRWEIWPCSERRLGIVEVNPGTAELPDWELISINPGTARWSMSMAYDSDRNVVVMFGGRSLNPPFGLLSDTWEWDGTSWSQVTTQNAPAPRFWHAMAYDSHRQRVVLFGGGDRDTATLYADTWEYDGVDWQHINTPHSPPAMDQMSMAYDSRSNETVLFGGQGLSGDFNATWKYDGLDWVEVNTASSPPRGSLAAMAYDAARGQVVFFGSGVVFEPPTDAATWEFDGGDWTQVNTLISPPGRWAHAMAYDSYRQRIVLFGGFGPSLDAGSQLDDTWEYDGSLWTQVSTPNLPGQREQHCMAYDSTRRRVVMFGGVGGVSGDDTWEYVDLLTPSEEADNILRFIDYAVSDGVLEGEGKGRSAKGRLTAFINKIESARRLIESGSVSDACDQLSDALQRTDGQTPPPDFVGGEAAPEVMDMIGELMTALGCT